MFHEKVISYFLDPFAEGYTLEKTITLGLIALAFIYVIYELLKKMKIKVDRRFAIALFPYIVFGSALRVWQDAGIVNSILFTTPNIYLLVFFVFFTTLVFSWYLMREKYYKITSLFGIVLASIALANIEIVNYVMPILDFAVFLPIALILYKIRWSKENKIVAGAQIFDGTTTYLAIKFFGYSEQHFVPSVLISLVAPEIFPLIKIIAVLILLYYLDRFVENKDERNYTKALIATLALATSIRDLLRVSALV